jgi:hypothetical protein
VVIISIAYAREYRKLTDVPAILFGSAAHKVSQREDLADLPAATTKPVHVPSKSNLANW